MTSVAWGLSSTQSHSKLEPAETRVSRGFRVVLFLFLLTSIWQSLLIFEPFSRIWNEKCPRRMLHFVRWRKRLKQLREKHWWNKKLAIGCKEKLAIWTQDGRRCGVLMTLTKTGTCHLTSEGQDIFLPLDVIWKKHVNMLNCRISSGNLLTNLAGAYEWIT